MRLLEIFNIFPALAANDDSANCQEQNVEEWIGYFRGLARVVKFGKKLRQGIDLHEWLPEKGSIRSQLGLHVKTF